MNERAPEQQPQQPAEGSANDGPWNPHEQIGDVYEVDIGDDGTVRRANLLAEPSESDNTSTEHDPNKRPCIWAGSWLDYNNGILHGRWIDADQDEDGLQTDIAAMLADSPTTRETGERAEDWGIFDHDNFGPLRLGEQESISWVTAVARGIAEHGLAFAAYADVMEDEVALEGFEDAYLGHYDSLTDYAEQLIDEAGYNQILDRALPDSIRGYLHIDTDMLGHDMQLGGDVHVAAAEDGGVWLFRAR